MNLSGKDYKSLYLLQDKMLAWWKGLGYPLYLTGGTALGRFYLNHRLSDDLDFFANSDLNFKIYTSEIYSKVDKEFQVNKEQIILTDDFMRFFIEERGISLKVELVNDVAYRANVPLVYEYGYLDTPLNILSNKLTALCGRDEPKDVFDILSISVNYSFNWKEVFFHSKQKAVINEIDVVQRLYEFPTELFSTIMTFGEPIDPTLLSLQIKQIADDFMLGRNNSLGNRKIDIESAVPSGFKP
jgi:predicted nucleotidyltransferase component of viral defense system